MLAAAAAVAAAAAKAAAMKCVKMSAKTWLPKDSNSQCTAERSAKFCYRKFPLSDSLLGIAQQSLKALNLVLVLFPHDHALVEDPLSDTLRQILSALQLFVAHCGTFVVLGSNPEFYLVFS